MSEPQFSISCRANPTPWLSKLNHLVRFLAFNYSKEGLIMAVETRGPCIIDASKGLEGAAG